MAAAMKWFAVFIIPVPVAMFITYCVIFAIGPERWSDWASSLYGAYARIGLYGVSYLFSWNFTTIFLIQSGIPYAALALATRSMIMERTDEFPGIFRLLTHRLLSWLAVLLISFPITLVILRVMLPLIAIASQDWPAFTNNNEQSFLMSLFISLCICGVPYAMVCFTLTFLAGKAMKKLRPRFSV